MNAIEDTELKIWCDANNGQVTSENLKEWIGASRFSDSESSENYDNFASTVVEEGASLLPGWNWVMDAGLILGKMTLAYNGENYQGDINRTWDWLNGNRPYDIYQQPQVCYFLQFEVIGMDPDETAYLDLENWTGCELSENYTRIDLENQHDINVTAPSTSPSTVKQMTTAEMRDNGFHSATISEIKRAPNRYPIPNSRIESYPDDHEIIFGQPTANTFPER